MRLISKKTEYLSFGEAGNDLSLDNNSIRNTNQFKYLGVTLGKTGKSDLDITNKINQGRRVIGQLNSVLWSKEISKKNKTTIYKTIVESIVTYGSEVWEVSKKNCSRLLALEMDFWRRSASLKAAASKERTHSSNNESPKQQNGHYRIQTTDVVWPRQKDAG